MRNEGGALGHKAAPAKKIMGIKITATKITDEFIRERVKNETAESMTMYLVERQQKESDIRRKVIGSLVANVVAAVAFQIYHAFGKGTSFWNAMLPSILCACTLASVFFWLRYVHASNNMRLAEKECEIWVEDHPETGDESAE